MRDILADVLCECKNDENGHNYDPYDHYGLSAEGAMSLTGSIATVPVYNTNNQPSPRLSNMPSRDEKEAYIDSASDDALLDNISWLPITTTTSTLTETIVNSNTSKDTRSPRLISRKSPIQPEEVLSENDTTWASSAPAHMVNNGGGYRSSNGSNGRKSTTQARRERLSIE